MNEMEGEFLWSSLLEHLSLQAISRSEKNKRNAKSGLKSNTYWGKMPELHWSFIRLEDYTIHETLNACLSNIKKKKKTFKEEIEFLFLLQSWENADTAFCIVADVMLPFLTFFL